MTRLQGFVLWLYIVMLALAGGTLHWFGVVPSARGVEPSSLVWLAVIAAGFFASERFVVHLRLGSEAFAFSMMEIPLVLGLYFLRPDLLLLCRIVGGGLAFLLQRKAARKVAFNVALFVLETSTAVAVWVVVLGDAAPLSPRGWLAACLAVLCTSMLSSLLVSVAIAIATGELPRTVEEVFSLGQIGDLANVCFALVAAYLITEDWRSGWLLLVLAGVLAFAYRSYERARLRSESLSQVNRFTEVVGREVEYDAVVRAVLVEVREAFATRAAHLRAVDLDGEVHDWCLEDEVPVRTHSSLIEALAPTATAGSVLAPRRTRAGELAAVLSRAQVKDCVMVPLFSDGHAVGRLAVADRLGEVNTFGPGDLDQLRAFANHAAVAIDNALRANLILQQAQERERQAMYDDLTGLANRRLLSSRMAECLAEGRAAVLLLDLDRFKEVNDTLGHEVGDRLLCMVASRLQAAVEPGALVTRFGGDEFAVLLPGADDLAASACASMLRDALARPFDLEGIPVAVEASMGVAPGAPQSDPSSLMRWADLAMHEAKSRRTGVEVFRPEMSSQDSSRLGLLADLRAAVSSNSLMVHYQPKVDIRSGRVEGVEALARWSHAVHGAIGPDEFIPLAEHSSLITPLTMLVLRTALRDCADWRRTQGDEFSVAVNISPRSLLDRHFVDEVARALAYAGVPSRSLTLEITETNLMAEPERAVEALHRLRDLGIRLSVDDLGTGYSSLAYLQRLPVDEIKIDRSFLQSLPDPSSRAIVGAVVDLGHRLGHRVVAEGVEDQAAYQLLGELGCDSAQGFWLGRPMPAEALAETVLGWAPPRSGHLRQVR